MPQPWTAPATALAFAMGAACALCPWTRTGEAIAYTFRSTTEAGSSEGELERLEES